MKGFLETVDEAATLLRDRGRLTIQALRHELELEDGRLEDLVDELVLGQQVAARDGDVLVWRDPSADRSGAASLHGRTVVPERRQLTVMFCDIVDSTELASRIDPEELREVVHDFRSVCVAAVRRYEGYVAQYLGDGVLVYFGTPQAHEDDPGRAIRAGLEIARVLRERPPEDRIAARIGIHTGRVLLDPGGQGDATLALGSAANVAARIQNLAKGGTVVASDATLSLCRGEFVSKRLGDRHIRGVAEPVLLHELQGIGVSALASVAPAPMVGREHELETLLACWSQVRSGRGRFVPITGDPGIGKSRLVLALRESLGESDHIWFDTHCSPYTSGSAFQPLVDLLTRSLTPGSTGTPEEASRSFVAGLESMPSLRREQVIPHLLTLLSLPPSERYPLPQTSAEEQRERILRALVDLMLSLTEQQSVVLVIEDLHWADPSTLEYITRLLDGAVGTKLMIVATYRPEFAGRWTSSGISELKLERLSQRSTREMITNVVGRTLPASILTELEARSDGVPLFAEELARSVLSGGLASEDSAETRDLDIPATLRDSLMARLDRAPEAKRLAQQAATLGREFPHSLIERVTELDPSELLLRIERLVSEDILQVRGVPPDAIYGFKHALVQDTAYESQLLANRRELHGRIASILASEYPERVEAEPEAVARHYEAAGEVGPAVDHYQRAAELALARFSNAEASELFARALDALDSLPEEMDRHAREIALRIAYGKAMTALRGYEDPKVVEAYARVETLCEAVGEGPQQLGALVGLLEFEVVRGEMSAWTERSERLLAIAEPMGIQEITFLGHSLIGGALIPVSATRAADRLGEALSIAQEIDFPPPATPYDHDLTCLTYLNRAVALVVCGLPEQAVDSLDRAAARAEEIDHDFSRAFSAALAANVGFLMRDPAFARTNAERALELIEGRGFHPVELMGRIYRAWGQAYQGDAERAVGEVESFLTLAQEKGFTSLHLPCIAGADVYRVAGRAERADELLDEARRYYERSGEQAFHGLACFTRARLRIAEGRASFAAAEQLLNEAIDTAEAFDDLFNGLLSATQLAQLALETGQVDEARARLEPHLDRMTEGLDRPPALEARAALDALKLRGDPSALR